MHASTLALLALAASSIALPVHDASKLSARHARRQSSTTIPGLDFPADQTNLTVPAGLYANEIAVGIGFQNYTCTAAGTYGNNQAMARLYDAYQWGSSNPEALIQAPATAHASFAASNPDPVSLYSNGSDADAAALAASQTLNYYGAHFIPSPIAGANGTVPRFHVIDGISGQDEFVVGKKTGALDGGKGNVAWLQLTNLTSDGTLATTFYRTHVQGGVPTNTSCDPSDTSVKSVPYAALYIFGLPSS